MVEHAEPAVPALGEAGRDRLSAPNEFAVAGRTVLGDDCGPRGIRATQ
jgi:hypothetical protein